MKKVTLLFLTLVMAATSSMLGEVPKTIQEAMSLIHEGKALKLPAGKKIYSRETKDKKLTIPSERSLAQDSYKIEKIENSQLNDVSSRPMKVTAGGSAIYGFCNFSLDQTVSPMGLYELEPDGIKLKWRDNFFYSDYYCIDSGFLIDDQLIGCAINSFMGYIFGYSRLVHDFETGELLSRIDYDYNDPNVVIYEMLAHNIVDGYVYGISYGSDQKYYWYRTTTSDFGSGEKIREVPDDITAMCFNATDNAFYALTTSGDFERIDVDGSVKTLFKLDIPQVDFRYMAGLIYSPVEKVYYASLSNNIDDMPYAYIATISLDEKKVKNLWQLPYANQFKTLVTTDETDENPLKPQTPTVDKISFENGSTSGYIDFLMPSLTMDGTAMEGTLYAFPSVNGTPVGPSAGYESAPGEILRVEYSDLSEGKDSFKLYVSDGKYTSRTLTTSFWVGNDNPEPPTKVVLTDHNVTWKAVKKSVHKGFIDPEEIVYKVYINDEFKGETKETEMSISLPTDLNYASYTASVIADFRGKESTPAFSNSVVSGKPYDLPLYFKATEESEKLCTIINANNDPAYWNFNSAYDAFNIGWSTRGNNNDWIILPAFEATSTDVYYTLTFETTRFVPSLTEEFLSVHCGTEPTVEGMSTEILPTFAPTTGLKDFEQIRVLFKASEVGPCYIGFHCTSAPNQFGLLIRDISIVDDNVTDNSPAQVLNLDAQPFEDGVLKATIAFNLPRKTIVGEQISKDTEVSATVTCKDTVKVSGRPGERISVVVDTDQGNNSISVMSSIGDLGSLVSETSVYTGVVPPVTPVITDLITSPDMQSITLKWNKVTTGENGGYVDPADIKYSIYTMSYDFWGNQVWKEYEQVGDATSYTYTCEPDTPLQLFYIGVSSYNSAGSNGTIRAQMAQIGTPYSLPLVDNFTYGYLEYPTWMTLNPFENYRAEFEFKEVAEIGNLDIDAKYLLMAVGEAGDKGRLAVPRFRSIGVDGAKVAITLYTGENSAPVTVYAGYTGAQKLINMGSVDANPDGPDFTTVTFDVPQEAMDKYWVQIYIDTELTDSRSLCLLKDISITSTTGVDEVIDLSGSVYGGKGVIGISGHNGERIRVTTVGGLQIADFTASSDEVNYPVAKGIYVVTTGNATAKVVVK